MTDIYDFSNLENSYKNGSYGGNAGLKEGVEAGGEEWMVKYPKNLAAMQGENASYSTSPLSEYIGSHIYDILGFDVHQTELGIRRGKVVVACKDFAADGKSLYEVRTLKNSASDELLQYLDHDPERSSETHIVDLEFLLVHLDKNPVLSKIPGIKNRFFEQAIVDVFIDNNDRNAGNWGILREKGSPDTLAPIFDNGGSFSSKMGEPKIERFLSDSTKLESSALNVLTAYGTNGHQYNAKAFFEAVADVPEFQDAAIKMLPLIKNKLPEIKALIAEIPEQVQVDGTEYTIISPERKELYIRQCDIRLEKLLVPELEKYTEKDIDRDCYDDYER